MRRCNKKDIKQDNRVTDRVQSWAQFVILAPEAIHCGKVCGMKFRLLGTTNKYTHLCTYRHTYRHTDRDTDRRAATEISLSIYCLRQSKRSNKFMQGAKTKCRTYFIE